MTREQSGAVVTAAARVMVPAVPPPAAMPSIPVPPPMPPPLPAKFVVEKPASPIMEAKATTTVTEIPAQDRPQLLNGVHCVIDYALDMPNVTKVEGYATKDGGQTWDRLGENADQKSPFEFELPGDGSYGLVLVASTANHPGQAPNAGDAPDWWVEIDTSKPMVQMTDVKLGTGDETGQLVLKWTVEDKNLGPDPVSLHWATSPSGPWTVGAKNMKTSGSARWAVPKDAGTRFYLRLEATDKAGNVGFWESKEAVVMAGDRRLKARIISVSVKR